MNVSKKPLVTFVLVAYKQEQYIREAIQSVLTQTYEPLEIIISDDCSPDLTFQYMKEEVEEYSGPHKINLNRNDNNIGLVRHLECMAKLSNGEFIVVQAGDDISHPDRTEVLVNSWLQPDPVDLVCSDVCVIDDQGVTIREGWHCPFATPLSLDEAVWAGNCVAIGCSCGYSRSLFTSFSPMNDAVFQEDNVLPFRALLQKGIRVVPDRLVEYRVHSNNTFHGTKKNKLSKVLSQKSAQNRWGIACDVIKAWDECNQPHDKRRKKLSMVERYWWYYTACTKSNMIGILRLATKGLVDGLTIRNALGLIWKHIFSRLNK